MERLLPATLLAVLSAPSASAAMSEQIVRYTIGARLDPAGKTITGRETLAWRNASPDSIPELRFHLYLNAF
jgi:hypothetical protein